MDTNPPGCLVCGRKLATRPEDRERFCSVDCAEDAGGAVTPAAVPPAPAPAVAPRNAVTQQVLEALQAAAPEDQDVVAAIIALFALEYDAAATRAAARSEPLDLTGAVVRAAKHFPPSAVGMAARVFPAVARRITLEMRAQLNRKTVR